MTYCKLGDLAFTVQAHNKENIGNIIRIVGSQGLGRWYDIEGLTWVWIVETQGSPLVYEDQQGIKYYESTGAVPDIFLRRIEPSEDLVEESKEAYHA